MATVFGAMADRLKGIDFQIDGQDASPANLESLFRVSFRTLAPNSTLPLSPRLCEEHLATALVAARQSIEARQAYFDAGDKFATLTLSLAGDAKSTELLASEAGAMSLRHNISLAAHQAESNNQTAVGNQAQAVETFTKGVDPRASGPAHDAARSKWLSYISRSVNGGFATMAPYWGGTSQTDEDPGGNVPLVLSPTTPVVDIESELAKRATLAAFRVTHERSMVDQSSVDASVVASQGRVAIATAAEVFDAAAAKLADDRHTAASLLLQNKLALTQNLALFDFKAQMELHRRRAQDLFLEAQERAAASLTGLRTVYGLALEDLPPTALESAEDLLFWCRDVARTLVGFDPKVVQQAMTLSARDAAGANWRHDLSQGIVIDAKSLHDLGFVVRLQNASVRFTGSQRSGFLIKTTTPANVNDRDVQGVERNVDQIATTIRLIAVSADDQDLKGRCSSARVVHNLCPSGAWTLQASGVGNGVDDLLLELDVSFLVS